MSGTRFARSGRCRFFVCLGVFVFMFGLVAIFHSSQQQIAETREQRLRCEQQQEALNDQLQSFLEQKIKLQKNYDRERNEHMETRRDLEQKLKDLTEMHSKQQLESNLRYEKLMQSHKLLQSQHNELITECEKTKKQHLDDTNVFEKKLQSLRSELQKDKNVQSGEIAMWREKYNTIINEKERLEGLLNAADSQINLQTRIKELEHTLSEYETHCDFKPRNDQQQISKPLDPPDTTRNVNSPQHGLSKPHNVKSFNEQEIIAPKPIKKLSEETETQLKQQQPDNSVKSPPLADGVDAKPASPLSAPLKQTSTVGLKPDQHALEANAHLKVAPNATSTTSSSNLPPLPIPPNKRKIPANVAPFPANFDELFKNDISNQKANDGNKLESVAGDGADIDAAAEEMPKNDNDNENNNRYANVVNDLEHKGHKAGGNDDSGAHEIKDHEFLNDQNFNLPAEDDNNFFDGGKNVDIGDIEKHNKDDNNGDDDIMGVGDIAVKNHNQLLDGDNLNNEVAGDQGKEFPDGLRLDDGNNEEDEDEDDYSNPAARQKAEAIRN